MSDTGTVSPAFYPKVSTHLMLSKWAWLWLKRQALDESEKDGGKPSASDVIERLIRAAAQASKQIDTQT